MEISKRDRLILINQYKILAGFNKDEADYYQELINILENGYSIFYSQLDESVLDDMPPEAGRFVLNILDLYRAIEEVKRSSQNEKLIGHSYSYFNGFDGNNESEYMGFCRFLIEVQGKFQEQKQYLSKNDHLNSHMPMIEKYERMLKISKEFPDKWRMSVEDAIKVLDA